METKSLLTTVEDVFQIEGRGTVITGLVLPHAPPVRKGTRVVLKTPLEATIATAIAEVESFRIPVRGDQPQMFGFVLADHISSERIPKGTKVYDAGDAISAC